MTTRTMDSSPVPAPTNPPSAPRPYTAPQVTILGSIEALTAGPSSGSIDQIVGASGGFQDGTS